MARDPESNDRLTSKTSTILIAVGDRMQVYRSVEEVPPHLRQKLIQSTTSPNSATVLIADEAGRREILRSSKGLPSELQSRLVRSLSAARKQGAGNGPMVLGWRQWAEIGLLGGIGLCLWLLAAWE
jgi:hypothetical protein